MFYYKSEKSLFICPKKLSKEGLHKLENPTIITTNLDSTNHQVELLESYHNANKYIILEINPYNNKRSYSLSNPNTLLFDKESEGDIYIDNEIEEVKELLNNNIFKSLLGIKVVNISHPNYKDAFSTVIKLKKRVNIVGLGDVGLNLLIGLRLLGYDTISDIGIYSRNENTLSRLEMEINQIYPAFTNSEYPDIHTLSSEQLFDCDMFIFAASKNVPAIGDEKIDVRLAQLDANRDIISFYAKEARKNEFKGIFAVVSDPVDHLCRAVYEYSNLDENGDFDMRGIAPENIKGFGLGVMNARAIYYSKKSKALEYLDEGRSFGPHGEGLIIANSVLNYDDEKSNTLTKMTREANLKVREIGFKPYIAPAYSSGSLSIISCLNGDWHYSSVMIGGVYFGMKNRITPYGQEWESLSLDTLLKERINSTYKYLQKDTIKIKPK